MDFQSNRDEELRRRILQTFADVPYPGDNNLVPVQERHSAEYRNTEHFFRGRRWQELAQARRALQTGGGLSFLTPEAWCFFLPAYQLNALSEESGLADIAWTTLFQLTPPRSADLDDFFQRQISCLSPAQQECVAAFVRLFHEREPEDTIIQAAAAFWEERVNARAAKRKGYKRSRKGRTEENEGSGDTKRLKALCFTV